MKKIFIALIAVVSAVFLWGAVTLVSAATATSESAPSPVESQIEPPAQNPATPSSDGSNPPIYLTFDDGPHDEHTSRILDILDRHGVKATFFVRGDQVTKYPETLAQIAQRGHAVGNHTQSHEELTRLDSDQVRMQLIDASNAIEQAGAPTPTCMRPPYGSENRRVRAVIEELGLSKVLWDVDTNDWKRPSVDTLTKRISAAEPGDVVLMHDGIATNPRTAEALEQALPMLVEKGYTFATIPSCNAQSTN